MSPDNKKRKYDRSISFTNRYFINNIRFCLMRAYDKRSNFIPTHSFYTTYSDKAIEYANEFTGEIERDVMNFFDVEEFSEIYNDLEKGVLFIHIMLEEAIQEAKERSYFEICSDLTNLKYELENEYDIRQQSYS